MVMVRKPNQRSNEEEEAGVTTGGEIGLDQNANGGGSEVGSNGTAN